MSETAGSIAIILSLEKAEKGKEMGLRKGIKFALGFLIAVKSASHFFLDKIIRNFL